MANSGVEWIDFSFDKAVEILYWIVNFTGVSYEAINVLIFGLFAIAWPLTTIFAVYQAVLLHRSKNQLQGEKEG